MSSTVIDKLSEAPANVIYQRRERCDHDTVILRLRNFGEGRLVLERVISRQHDVSPTIVLPVRSERSLQEFAGADPWRNILAPVYEDIGYKCRQMLGNKTPLNRSRRTGSIEDLFLTMTECDNEFDLAVILDSLAGMLGAEQYCVSWIERDSRADRATHRYLLGCDPAWMQKYVYRSGYMNDPSFEYAKRNASPATSSLIEADSGEHWWFQEAKRHGLSNTLTCPVHDPARERMTVLQVAVGGDTTAGDAVLMRNQRDWHSAANALSTWRLTQLTGLAAQFGLDVQELSVLRARLHWKDVSSETIADEFNLSSAHVKQTLHKSIKRKMGVAHINDAVTVAFKCGLVS